MAIVYAATDPFEYHVALLALPSLLTIISVYSLGLLCPPRSWGGNSFDTIATPESLSSLVAAPASIQRPGRLLHGGGQNPLV